MAETDLQVAPVLDVHVRRHVVDAAFAVPLTGALVTALFGPSGAGKTTVLRALAGLERTSGHVRVGTEWWDNRDTFVPPRRRRVGYLFQQHALFPHLDVTGNVAYGLHLVPRRERAGRVAQALQDAGATHLARRPVRELSGGEAQRVALARALARGPRLLLLDEPLSALDTPTRSRLRRELRQILLRQQIPTLVVTHDRTEALALADRVIVMIDGRVRQIGSPQEVFERPVDAAVAEVVGVETAVPGVVTSLQDDLVGVLVGGRTVYAVSDNTLAPGDSVLVCIRAEDVALHPPDDGLGGSPRNQLASTVIAAHDEGALTRIELDAGFRLSAYVTRQAARELHPQPGTVLRATVKSPAVHLLARPGA